MAASPAAPAVEFGRRPAVLALDDPRATDPAVTGAKAANLAKAAVAGLSTLPGFVLTTTDESSDVAADAAVRDHWERLSLKGSRPLVVRSSSTAEDTEASSLAGQFTSVLDVRGWQGFVDAVAEVRHSAVRVGRRLGDVRPMAVLVQPHLETECAGVLFGLDPVTGQVDRVVVEAVSGSPEGLVSGRVLAEHYLLSARGRQLEGDGRLLDRRQCRQLARLAHRAGVVFGVPQDVEWGYADGRLWLLQSRPVTAYADRPAHGAVLLGPGPVAETFPAPLRPLEVDLWVEPLRDGVAEALHLTGAATHHRLARTPLITTVEGRIAADLELLGVVRTRRGRLAALNPFPAARHLAAAWRVGRLRAALPGLAADLLADTDAALGAVPSLTDLDDADLAALLPRCRDALVALHGHEVLAGTLLDHSAPGPTAAGLALRAVADGRARGLSDDAILREHPVVLALVLARIGERPPLPAVAPHRQRLADLGTLPPREALRLRTRWLQELSACAAAELGRRLHRAGRLPDPELVVQLSLDELGAAVAGAALPADLADRAAWRPGPPLPTAFHLSTSGAVRARADRHGTRHDGQAAGSGRGAGRVVSPHGVCTDGTDAEPQVLVTRTLDPDLAPLLPHLAGLVSETGSSLSHLAILARELHVPAVVGVPDALRRFPPGTGVLVDGLSGEVTVVDPAAPVPASAREP